MTNSPPLPGRRAEYSMLTYTLKRLLQAVQEDPDDVNRRQAQPARGRRPKKPW